MNRKEFQKWLDKFPEDTIIRVGVQQEPPDYHAYGVVYWGDFKGHEYEDYEFADFINNPFVKPTDDHYKKRYLDLGQSN